MEKSHTRKIISLHRLTEALVLKEYPELADLARRKHVALITQRNAEGVDNFLAAHAVAKPLCLEWSAEIDKRYSVLI